MSARRELIRRLSEDSYGGIATLQDVTDAEQLLDTYRAEVLAEVADKLVLELAPEQSGAGPGFLLALRLAVRAMRRMADEAATGGAS
ncbi:hypothetical protein [Streptomyces sp900116325]|uniref:hypothetical protein n=1 Tax=Streptomyces sp. 900116325 TaxID=3154295 RepID=UPI0033B81429